ncbi:methyl-accepting chemotaxis protein [Trichloromonas sp.]|uniref:methyl-accepting chemotaxis protein n=1 Tax=Trichloromonas sp. TaxID=3069249 RepID=UPI002A4BC63B|nr:methyl-accepting chemotaxis protein [Trichloromonas sp.]
MPDEGYSKISYLRKLFYLTHGLGLGAGFLFPLAIGPLLATETSFPLVFAGCLLVGLLLSSAMFCVGRLTLKKQLRRQIDLLRPLVGDIPIAQESVEALDEALTAAVGRADTLVRQLLATTDQFLPHHRGLTQLSHFLSERSKEGIKAATHARQDMQTMEGQQQEVILQVESLSEKAQDEAAWSRELSASLAEMSGAMEHSTAKFLETTATVDQMAASIHEIVTQTEAVTHSVEGTTHDLDSIGETLARVQSGAIASAQSANMVKEDAENGLQVVRSSMAEMARIEEESRKATDAMERLSRQTREVAKIIEVIKELVSDTELLAFNAAIIAAKAGEEGKGFSVVAEEIRDLADRTTTSAQDIQQIVKAIGGDTQEVTTAVDATARAIAKGRELSQSAGEALSKIFESSNEAAAASDEIAELTEQQGRRARALLNDAGRSLQSVKSITRIVQEQQVAIAQTQEGVSEMKAAADQIARGMAEQVKANRQFDHGLAEREVQVRTIFEATRHQRTMAEQILAHFAKSEERLKNNALKSEAIGREAAELENLTRQLKELGGTFIHLETPGTPTAADKEKSRR